jgi:hypothetical protein
MKWNTKILRTVVVAASLGAMVLSAIAELKW